MPDYEKAARKAAAKYGIDPAIFIAQLKQESGLRPGLTSGAGAQGIAQFMPATAKAYGVNLHDGKATDDLDGAARYMRDNLDRTGDDYAAALSIYNSGKPDAYKNPQFAGGQTYDYVKGILAAAKAAPKVKTTPSRTTTSPFAAPTSGVDNSAARLQAVSGFLEQGGVRNSDATLSLAGTYGSLADAPATTTATAPASYGQPQRQPKVKATPKNVGAQAALDWAESKIGFKEATGNNDGGLASYANSRFGMINAPWCAMFTSLAVTKGGAPKTARTASVAEVRRQAEHGGGGYRRGFVNAAHAKAGDLILFGNDHIGMVQRVEHGKVFYVGGNQSNGVTEAQVAAGDGDIVRPKYGSRKQ